MQKITIYHNPRCSKSREMLKYLKENNYEVEEVLYLVEDLSKEDYKKLFDQVENPEQFIRKNEADYKALDKKPENTKEMASAVHKSPRIMQRPILKLGDRAIVARPMEMAIEWLNSL